MDSSRPNSDRTVLRKRSRSPRDHTRHDDVKRHRSRSPYRQSSHHHTHRSKTAPQARLPLHARHLHKRDLDSYRAVFTEYLDIQKQIDIDALSEDKVKGRWKSFLGKWNRGELAEGWYDPETKAKADARQSAAWRAEAPVRDAPRNVVDTTHQESEDEDEDEDGYGPALPDMARKRIGPTVPGMQDLQHKQELAQEDREARIAGIRNDRKLDRKAQKEQLDDLAPRAEPGSRERQLEKKRENAAANRSFADAKEGGDQVEVGDKDLMGEDGVEGYKAQVKATERRKNEREVRKEEVLRARAEEREERMSAYRRKEDKTVEMLRGLAKARFG